MNQPRRHHYIAQMFLAGFTNAGTKDGKLWMADLNRAYHKNCRPDGIAYSRDFYRVDIPDVDPFIIERELAALEGDVATILKDVLENKKFRGETDLSLLLNFVALQMAKTPAMRETNAKPVVAVADRTMALILKDSETYYSTLEGARNAGIDISANVSYEKMKWAFDHNRIIASTSQNWDVISSLEMADAALPILHDRNWTLIVPEKENDVFICSDHPVIVYWLDDKIVRRPPGLGLRGTAVFIPLGSNMALRGVFEDAPPSIVVDAKQVASYNVLTLMNSYGQIYSRDESFKAINPAGDIVQLSVAELAADPTVYLTKVNGIVGETIN